MAHSRIYGVSPVLDATGDITGKIKAIVIERLECQSKIVKTWVQTFILGQFLTILLHKIVMRIKQRAPWRNGGI